MQFVLLENEIYLFDVQQLLLYECHNCHLLSSELQNLDDILVQSNLMMEATPVSLHNIAIEAAGINFVTTLFPHFSNPKMG